MTFVHTSMYYPVTDAAMDTESYDQFAEGYYLTRKAMDGSGMPIPPTRPSGQRSRLSQPGHGRATSRAAPDPAAVDEVDPLRDEGEATPPNCAPRVWP